MTVENNGGGEHDGDAKPAKSLKTKLKKGCMVIVAIYGGTALALLIVGGISGSGNDQQASPDVSASGSPLSTTEPVEEDTPPTITAFNAKRGASCGSTGRVTQIDFAVKTEAPLTTGPYRSAKAVQIKVGDSLLPAPMEEDASIRELCRQGSWSEVRVLTAPSEFHPLQGWVPTAALREVKTTNAGRRVYDVSDFTWPAGTARYRAPVVQVVNRIIGERPDCDAIDVPSLTVSGSGEGAAYSIACIGEGESRSFSFKAGDARNGRSFAPVEPIDKMAAIDACKNAVLTRANHPSTVDFPMFDYDYRDGGDGRTQLLMSAKAKNGFGLELGYDVQCDFKGAVLDDFVMSEASE